MHSLDLKIERGGAAYIAGGSRNHVVRDDHSTAEFEIGSIKAVLDKRTGLLVIDVPFTSTDQLFHRSEGDCISISSDLRNLHRMGQELDPHALYSILQFGAVIPPMSVWKDVGRFTPGRIFKVDCVNLLIKDSGRSGGWSEPSGSDHTLDDNSQLGEIVGLIDTILEESCPDGDPVILFSGGVDSGLLAARASARGWSGTTLVNYSMGEDDTEAALAREMASYLGLEFIQIDDADVDNFELLDRAVLTFANPFGDHSSLPTYSLSMEVLRRFTENRVVVDGTGADGAFGLYSNISRLESLYRVPRFVRMFLGNMYGVCGCWKYDTAAEYFMRWCHRTSRMPPLSSFKAQNPLDGIFYDFPREGKERVFQLLEEWIVSAVPVEDEAARLIAVDLALVCGSIFAQKNKSIFDSHSRSIEYPFMDKRMTGLAIMRARLWPGHGERKRIIKSLLASQVPRSMVYRPKSGFIAPVGEKFARPEFMYAFDKLLDSGSAFENLLDHTGIFRLKKLVERSVPLPPQTYSFIWTAVFCNLWLDQIKNLTPFDYTFEPLD